MKRFCIAIMLCMFFAGCSPAKSYSLKKDTLVLEVNLSKEEADKQILDCILLNDKELTDEDEKNLSLDYDEAGLKALQTFEAHIYKDDTEVSIIKVTMQDTTKPEIEMTEKELAFGANIEEYMKITDNYDGEEELRKGLIVEGYDAKAAGSQEVVIRAMDSSHNEAELVVEVIVKEATEPEGASSIHSTQGNVDSSTANVEGNGGSVKSGGRSSFYDANGNEITEEEYYKIIEEANQPIEPNYVCPTVPHHMEGNIEVWDGDPNLPCDWTPNHLGNTGLEYDTEEEAWAYMDSIMIPAGHIGGFMGPSIIRYNGGWVTWSPNIPECCMDGDHDN